MGGGDALPGCVTEGESMEEVMANLKDAIEGWLAVVETRQRLQENALISNMAKYK